MKTLDETDLGILRLLVDDSRRPYSDIADEVDVSAPTVSDRIDRLEELGIIESFTLEIDRTKISNGIDVLIDVTLKPNVDDRVVDRFGAVEQVEHVFRTADSHLFASATVAPDRVRAVLAEAIDVELVEEYRVHIVEERAWSPTIGDAELALSCDECNNTVTSEGVSLRLDGDLYHFCCPTCRSSFQERYATLADSA